MAHKKPEPKKKQSPAEARKGFAAMAAMANRKKAPAKKKG